MNDRFEALGARYLPEILALVDATLCDSTPDGSSLVALGRYHLETGGKRLRALLPLLVAEALDADPARLVPFGAACELLHNATLVHDDLQDGDTHRRGRETVWSRFGMAQAVNLGDAMFYWAVLLVYRLDAPLSVREAAARRLMIETLRVIDGQEREFALLGAAAPTLADYTRMVEGKTSGLFALPMAGAAEALGAPADVVEGLAEAARHMGVLFQVQDDVLDLYADKGRGTRGSDIGEGKRSALVVHCLNHAPADDAATLRAILGRPREETTAADVDRVAALFEQTGSLRYAVEELERRRAAAETVPAVAARPALRDLVRSMCDRFLSPIAPVLAGRAEVAEAERGADG